MAFAAETICVQGSNERKDPFGAISMPIYQNAAYAHPGLGKSTGYDYSRCSNPTRDEVQKTVALLEQGTGNRGTGIFYGNGGNHCNDGNLFSRRSSDRYR